MTALLVFVLLVFGAAMCATRDAREVARSHLDRIKAGKTDLAYQQLSPDAQAATSFEQYAALIAERPILREIETISFPEFERNNNTVTLKGRVRTAAGVEFEIPVRLRKESGQWYILGIDFSGVPAGDASSMPVPSAESAPLPGAEGKLDARHQSSAPTEPSSRAQGTSKAREAALRHVRQIQQNQLEQAYRETSPAFQEMVTFAQYRAILADRPILRDITDLDTTEFADTENTLIYAVHAQCRDGQSFDIPMRLRKEAGQWRVIAADWTSVPVGSAAARSSASAADAASEASVGTITIGSGRTADGALIRPRQSIPRTAEWICADIELLKHSPGNRVRVWIETADGQASTEVTESAVGGQGRGSLPYNLRLSEGIPPGNYRLMVMLQNGKKFIAPFKVE